MSDRRRLDNRRHHWIIDFTHDGFRYTVGFGKFDDGTLAELFIDASAKSGIAVEAAAHDAERTVEAEAMPARIPRDIVRDEVEALLPPNALKVAKVAEESERAYLRSMAWHINDARKGSQP